MSWGSVLLSRQAGLRVPTPLRHHFVHLCRRCEPAVFTALAGGLSIFNMCTRWQAATKHAWCHLSAVKKNWEEVDLPLWFCLRLLHPGCDRRLAHSLIKWSGHLVSLAAACEYVLASGATATDAAACSPEPCHPLTLKYTSTGNDGHLQCTSAYVSESVRRPGMQVAQTAPLGAVQWIKPSDPQTPRGACTSG